jgi:hypothetical protein
LSLRRQDLDEGTELDGVGGAGDGENETEEDEDEGTKRRLAASRKDAGGRSSWSGVRSVESAESGSGKTENGFDVGISEMRPTLHLRLGHSFFI